MIIQQLQTKQINCAVCLSLTIQGQSHQSTHVSLRYNNLITLQHSLWTKNTSCLATNVVRINYHYCAICNKGRRVTTQKRRVQTNQQWKTNRIIFLIGMATQNLLVNKISSSKGKQLCFYHASCSFTMINHYHNINGRFKGKVQSQTLLVTNQCTYVGVYEVASVYTNICRTKKPYKTLIYLNKLIFRWKTIAKTVHRCQHITLSKQTCLMAHC